MESKVEFSTMAEAIEFDSRARNIILLAYYKG